MQFYHLFIRNQFSKFIAILFPAGPLSPRGIIQDFYIQYFWSRTSTGTGNWSEMISSCRLALQWIWSSQIYLIQNSCCLIGRIEFWSRINSQHSLKIAIEELSKLLRSTVCVLFKTPALRRKIKCITYVTSSGKCILHFKI